MCSYPESFILQNKKWENAQSDYSAKLSTTTNVVNHSSSLEMIDENNNGDYILTKIMIK